MALWYKKKENPRYKIWSEKEIRMLGNFVKDGYSFPDLGIIFRRNPGSVYNKACREGFYVPRRRKWTDVEEDLLQNQYASVSRLEAAKLLGRTPQAIGHRRFLLNAKKKRPGT